MSNMHQGLDLSRFKKVSSDKTTTTLRHAKGHEIRIAHSGLTPAMRERLEALPAHMAEGGAVPKDQVDTKVPEVEARTMPPAAITAPPPAAAKSDGIPRNADGMIDAGTVTPSSFYDVPTPSKGNPAVAPAPKPIATPDEPAPPDEPSTPDKMPLDSYNYDPPPPDPVKMTADDLAWQQDLRNGHIHPKTYADLFESKSTLGRIGTLFGMMVGGTGAGMSHQPNALLGMMTKELDQDLEAQKASKENAVNYLRLSQQHELQKAQIEQMGYQNQLTQGQIAKIPSEIELSKAQAAQMPMKTKEIQANTRHLNADTDLVASNAAINKMKIAMLHDLQSQVDKMPPGANRSAAEGVLQNNVVPAVEKSVVDGNAQTAAQVKARQDLRKQGKPQAKPGAPGDTGVDWMKFNLLQKQGQMNSSMGMPGGMVPSDVGQATQEATKVQDNRAMLKNFVDSYDKLDKMALGGHLSPGYRKAQINTIAASIARETAGRYNAAEAAAQMDGMFPTAGDWKSTRVEKRAKAIEYFRMQEAGTPTLDRFGLKTNFPFPGGEPGSGARSREKTKDPEPENVKIQAPDGSTRLVPKASAEKYIKKGGRVIP